MSLWPGESRKHEEHSKPGFHRRLSLRLCQISNAPKPSDAGGSRMIGNVIAHLSDGDQPGMKEHVRRDNAFCQRISASEVDHCTEC